MTSRKQQNWGRFIFCGEGDVWLLLNTFHVFLIVKIQYSLKDQSTTGQILLSDVYVWLILFLGSSEIWGTAFCVGHLVTWWKWGAAAPLGSNIPQGAVPVHSLVPVVRPGSHAAPKEAGSRQKKGMDLSGVLSFLELPQVHNSLCYLLSASAKAAPPHFCTFHTLSPPIF